VSSHNVYLHLHQPDLPNQCGGGAHEAWWKAFPNRQLRKQGQGAKKEDLIGVFRTNDQTEIHKQTLSKI
jgi:hypothetical protein